MPTDPRPPEPGAPGPGAPEPPAPPGGPVPSDPLPSDSLPSDPADAARAFNSAVVEEFRARGGRVGGPFEGARLLLLTTTGARTGAPRTVPLGYLPHESGFLVIGSAGGSDRHPQWYRNLLADPLVTVEDGVFRRRARAVVLTGAERDAAFARAAEADPGWAGYQAGTSRTLPVVVLEPAGPPSPTTATMGQGLVRIHDAFRRELALVRREVAAGPGLGAQVRINCLAVCEGLHHHHGMEDAGLLPLAVAEHPELGEAVARLQREHRVVAELLEQLQRAVGERGAAPGDVLPEVDRLIALLEAHLDYEEEQLVPLLDAIAV